MHIVYAVSACSEAVYEKLFAHTKVKPGFQSVKYHRLLIEGLAAWCKVDVVANPPVNRSVMAAPVVRLPEETLGNAHYHYISAYRNPVRKLLHVGFGTFLRTWKLARKDSAVVIDCLNVAAGMAALAASRLRGCRCVGIITDLPDLLGMGRVSGKLSRFLIDHCTDYVLLTQAMNTYIRNPGKPYVVLEGHADITMREQIPALERKTHPRVCLYAGSLSKRYGLADLVEGFRMANIPDTQLHIYGSGSYTEELQQIAAEDSRIVYGGMLLPNQVVPKEMEATLLVNPRPSREEFVKYSFPSKTMEYLSTGTPVLMTRLPGVPEAYKPHLFFIEEETAQGIARALQEVLGNSEIALFQKGIEGRNFVLEQRNNVVQAKKIVEMLEKCRIQKK